MSISSRKEAFATVSGDRDDLMTVDRLAGALRIPVTSGKPANRPASPRDSINCAQRRNSALAQIVARIRAPIITPSFGASHALHLRQHGMRLTTTIPSCLCSRSSSFALVRRTQRADLLSEPRGAYITRSKFLAES
jgi:hypothetical protein